MENNKKGLKLPINLLDIIIIILVLLIAGGLIFLRVHQSAKPADVGSADGGSGTVVYTVEMTNVTEDTINMIHEGDRIVDKIKKYNMGQVVSAELIPQTKDAVDYQTGDTYYSEIPGQFNCLVTIECDCTYSDSSIALDGGYEVRTGNEANIIGPGYAGTGYVVGIERGDK